MHCDNANEFIILDVGGAAGCYVRLQMQIGVIIRRQDFQDRYGVFDVYSLLRA